jgi:hypothetical protein
MLSPSFAIIPIKLHKFRTTPTIDSEFLSTYPWDRYWHEFYILSIGTNPLDIISSFVHVGFGVWCLCRNLALKARLSGKVHQAPHDKTSKPSTSQAMKWTWLQEDQGPTCDDRKLRGPEQKMRNLAGQGASSKLRRNWHQEPTCRRENTLEGSGRITSEGGHDLGRSGPRSAGPGPAHFGAQSCPPLT